MKLDFRPASVVPLNCKSYITEFHCTIFSPVLITFVPSLFYLTLMSSLRSS